MNDFRITELKYWCQKVLPLVYDDSLSYYELLCKVVHKLNEMVNTVNGLPEYIRELIDIEHLKPILSGLLDELREQIATVNEGDSKTATADRNAGVLVWLDNKLYKVTRNMLAGDQYFLGSNIEKVSVEILLNRLADEITNVDNNLDGEIQDRINADNVLQANIDTEEQSRINADNILQTNIDNEAQARINADNDILSKLSEAGNVIKPESFGAIGDGVADDTQALQDCIDYANTNGKIVLLTKTYLITNNITLYSHMNIMGNGGVIKSLVENAGVPTRDLHGAIDITNCEDVNIQGITFVGQGARTTGWKRSYTIGGKNSKYITVKDCKFLDIDDLTCVCFNVGEHCTVDNCYVKEYSQSAFMLQDGTKYSVVKNCTILNGRNTGNVDRYAISLNAYTYASVQGDRFVMGVGNKALNNYIEDELGEWEGIDAHGGYQLEIAGNTIKNCCIPIAVFTDESRDFRIYGADIHDNYCYIDESKMPNRLHYLGAFGGRYLTIRNNSFIFEGISTVTPDLTKYFGIKVQGVVSTVIENNMFFGCPTCMIAFVDSCNCAVNGNWFQENATISGVIYLTNGVTIANVEVHGNIFRTPKLLHVEGTPNGQPYLLFSDNDYSGNVPQLSPATAQTRGYMCPDVATDITGYYGIKGRMCWNINPAAGGTPGWVCVGTNTWKRMAVLEA